MNQNPYQTPQNAPGATANEDVRLESVRNGQRMIIFGILAYFAAIFLQFVIGPFAGPFAVVGLLVSLILGLIGIIRLSSGLGYNVGLVVLFLILMVIPIVGLVTLLILNSKATKVLREHGYRVGLLGAAK